MLDDANNIANALNWLRGKESKGGFDDPDLYSVGSRVPSKPLFGGKLTLEEQRAKEMEEALSWLRNNDLNYDQMDEPSLATYNKIESMIPGAMEKDANDVAATMESALDWLRSNDASKPFSLDDISIASSFKKVPGLGLGTIEEARVKDMENALSWLRTNNAVLDDVSVVSSFSKVSLPGGGFTAEERRAQEMSAGLDWLRNRNPSSALDLDNMSAMSRSMMGGQYVKAPTPEELRAVLTLPPLMILPSRRSSPLLVYEESAEILPTWQAQ
jgi:hypothetical protein